MLESALKSPYHRFLLMPFIKLIKPYEIIKPIHITFLAGIVGILAAISLNIFSVYLAIALLLISGWLDSLDGAYARFTQQTSEIGAVLDIFIDRIVEATIIIGFYFQAPSQRGLICLVMLAACYLCITAFLVVGIMVKDKGEKSFFYCPGVMERAETFVFFIAMMLLPKWFNPLAIVFIGLVLFTALMRIYYFCNVSPVEKTV